MEIVKFIQVYFINWDVDMYYAARDIPFQCRALNINEDLGQIQYIFSDKTGTLTENEMRFQCCTIAGVNYPHQLKGKALSPCLKFHKNTYPNCRPVGWAGEGTAEPQHHA